MEKFLTAIIDMIKGIMKSKTTKVVGRTLGIIGVYVIATEIDVVANALRIFWHNNRDRILFFRNRVFCSLLLSVIMIIIGLSRPVPVLTGLGFLLATITLMAAWLPIGIALNVLGVNREVYVPAIRVVAAWIAFLGFWAMMMPELFHSLLFIVALGLLAFIFGGFSVGSVAGRKLAKIITLALCFLSVMDYAFPSYKRTHARFFTAHWLETKKVINRNSSATEAEATKTYVKAIRTVTVYDFKFVNDTIKQGGAIKVNGQKIYLQKDSIALQINVTTENVTFHGVSFIKIRMKDDNNEYITGREVYIPADAVVQINELPVETSVVNSNATNGVENGRSSGHFGPNPGVYTFTLKHAGDHSGLIIIDGANTRYNLDVVNKELSWKASCPDGFKQTIHKGEAFTHNMSQCMVDVKAMSDNQMFTLTIM